MARSIFMVLLLPLLLALAACGPSANPPAEQEEEELPSTATVTVVATVAPPESDPATVTPEAYPVEPTLPAVEEGYPVAPATFAPPTAYPADLRIWILRPLGNQCADPDSYVYASLEEAVTTLEEAGIEVFAAETVDLTVCESCDCPTSQHFRIEILRSDLPRVQTFGWYQES